MFLMGTRLRSTERESEDLVSSLDFKDSFLVHPCPTYGFLAYSVLLHASLGPLVCFSSAAQSGVEHGLKKLMLQEPRTLHGSNC